MRLATWNCYRGDAGLRATVLADIAPDLLILQECARPRTGTPEIVWLGGKPHHGVALSVRAPYAATQVDPSIEDDSAYPCRITGPLSFNLLAVWAKPRPTYVASIWACLDRHADWIREGDTLIAGDLNSHARWDRNGRPNHTDLVARLRDDFGLVSAWHAVAARSPGTEEPATIYHRRRAEAPYHIDYIFVPEAWVGSLQACWVPDDIPGARGSDHRPVVVDIAQ